MDVELTVYQQRRIEAEKKALEAEEPAHDETEPQEKLRDEESVHVLDKGKDEIVPGLPATTCLARIGRPLFKMIDAPWKVSPPFSES